MYILCFSQRHSVALAGINEVSTSLVHGKGQFELVSNGISTLHYEDWVNSCHSHIHLTVKGDVWACMCSWSCISAEPSPVKFCESLWQWASWLGFQYPAFPVCSVFLYCQRNPKAWIILVMQSSCPWACQEMVLPFLGCQYLWTPRMPLHSCWQYQDTCHRA